MVKYPLQLQILSRFFGLVPIQTSNQQGGSKTQRSSNDHRHISLPQEIILLILQMLVDPGVEFGKEFDAVTSAGHRQTHLLPAMRVSRSWYEAGIDLLYSQPRLVSMRRVELFAQTIKHRPDLGRLVRELYVFHQSSRHPHYRSSIRHLLEGTRKRKLVRSKLITILQQCPSLGYLVISSEDQIYPYILPFDETFVSKSGIQSHLRRLTISGSVRTDNQHHYRSHFLPPDVSLPSLEILSLRNIHFPPQYHFPILPKLHTLQIARCWHTNQPPIKSRTFPSLRVLESYMNSRDYPTIDHQTWLNLDSFHYCSFRIRYFTTDWPPFPDINLRQASLGVFTSGSRLFLPRMKLHSLTLWINLAVRMFIDKGVLRSTRVILDLFDDLQLKLETVSNTRDSIRTDTRRKHDIGFVELNLRISPVPKDVPLEALGPVHHHLSLIQAICETLGIKFHSSFEGHTAWVSRKLNQTNRAELNI